MTNPAASLAPAGVVDAAAVAAKLEALDVKLNTLLSRKDKNGQDIQVQWMNQAQLARHFGWEKTSEICRRLKQASPSVVRRMRVGDGEARPFFRYNVADVEAFLLGEKEGRNE